MLWASLCCYVDQQHLELSGQVPKRLALGLKACDPSSSGIKQLKPWNVGQHREAHRGDSTGALVNEDVAIW